MPPSCVRKPKGLRWRFFEKQRLTLRVNSVVCPDWRSAGPAPFRSIILQASRAQLHIPYLSSSYPPTEISVGLSSSLGLPGSVRATFFLHVPLRASHKLGYPILFQNSSAGSSVIHFW